MAITGSTSREAVRDMYNGASTGYWSMVMLTMYTIPAYIVIAGISWELLPYAVLGQFAIGIYLGIIDLGGRVRTVENVDEGLDRDLDEHERVLLRMFVSVYYAGLMLIGTILAWAMLQTAYSSYAAATALLYPLLDMEVGDQVGASPGHMLAALLVLPAAAIYRWVINADSLLGDQTDLGQFEIDTEQPSRGSQREVYAFLKRHSPHWISEEFAARVHLMRRQML